MSETRRETRARVTRGSRKGRLNCLADQPRVNAKPVQSKTPELTNDAQCPMPRKGRLANNDPEEKGRASFPDVELRITYA